MHDVAIIGAGPGGSATAHVLAQRGLDVRMLDKFEFPRDKTCGDGLTPRALRALDRIGMLDEVTRHGQPIAGFEVIAPNGRATRSLIGDAYGALVVRRRALDDLLRQRAIASGASFEGRVDVHAIEPTDQAVVVHGTQDGRSRTLEARMAVVATGAATGVLVRSGILPRAPAGLLAARAYFENIAQELSDRLQLRFDGVHLPGYGWVFPLGGGAANIGVGFLPSRGRSSGTSRAAFERFIHSPGVRSLLSGARQVGPLKGYPIRVDFLQAPTLAERTLLVGEAAGLVNPLTGEGIDYALESGLIAAEHVLDAFTAGDFSRSRLQDYHHQLHAHFRHVFRFCVQVRDWYCLPPVLNLLVPLANRHPELRQQLTDLVLGSRQPPGYGPLRILVRLVSYLATHRPPHGMPVHD